MSESKYDALKIENQICFPLYACSREIIKSYKPFLGEIDLTYTQYIAKCSNLEPEEAAMLYRILYKILRNKHT